MTTTKSRHTSTLQKATAASTSLPALRDMIAVARQGRSFQTRVLLQHIVAGEQQRMREEQMLWRLGGALLGACLGLGDGFQAADVFLGMGFSSLAGLSHEVMSNEDRRFLENCHSLWTVGNNSPSELVARLGPARSRILVPTTDENQPALLAHHQGHRGETLVRLGIAQDLAAGFSMPQSLDVMQRHLSSEALQLLQHQLYPDAAVAVEIQGIQPIKADWARQLDDNADVFLEVAEPVVIATHRGKSIGYRIPIPVHSDF